MISKNKVVTWIDLKCSAGSLYKQHLVFSPSSYICYKLAINDLQAVEVALRNFTKLTTYFDRKQLHNERT